MFLRRLLIFGYPLAEVLVLWGVATLIGWPVALLLLIAGIPAGAALIRNAAAKSTLLREASDIERPAIAQSVAGMFLSGVLIMIPGFITDIAGALVLVPPIQRWVMRRTGVWLEGRMTKVPGFTTYAQGDIVQGIVLFDDSRNEKGEGPPHDPSPEISR